MFARRANWFRSLSVRTARPVCLLSMASADAGPRPRRYLPEQAGGPRVICWTSGLPPWHFLGWSRQSKHGS